MHWRQKWNFNFEYNRFSADKINGKISILKSLESNPNTIKISPDGKLLFIGFYNGDLQFYEIIASEFGNDIQIKKVDIISYKSLNIPVINAEFS